MKIEPEWIEWKGGRMPVGSGDHVVYELRNGYRRVGLAGYLKWRHDDDEYDIIAYAPLTLDIEPYKPQPKWWVAEKGWLMCEGKVVAESILWADPRAIADALNAAGVEL